MNYGAREIRKTRVNAPNSQRRIIGDLTVPRSPLDFDVSVRANKPRRARRSAMSGSFDSAQRGCEWPGCDSTAAYRAPMSRARLDAYHWFCLDHVRQYNAKWDFFDGMSAEEIEDTRHASVMWDRDTRALTGDAPWAAFQDPHAEGQAWRRAGLSDPLDALGERATINAGASGAGARPTHRRLPKAEQKALEVLGLEDDTTQTEIRKRYGELVKIHHPDMNGGDRGAEDRLKAVIHAYNRLKKSPFFQN